MFDLRTRAGKKSKTQIAHGTEKLHAHGFFCVDPTNKFCRNVEAHGEIGNDDTKARHMVMNVRVSAGKREDSEEKTCVVLSSAVDMF